MKLTMSIKELLSASSTKKKLTCILGQGLLEYYSWDSSVFLVVVYDTIKRHDINDPQKGGGVGKFEPLNFWQYDPNCSQTSKKSILAKKILREYIAYRTMFTTLTVHLSGQHLRQSTWQLYLQPLQGYGWCPPNFKWFKWPNRTPFVAAWRSSNSVGRINEVTLRRARLVLGWVTCTGWTPGGGTLFRYVTSHTGRLSLSSFRGR